MIDFGSEKSEILLNPRMETVAEARVRSLLEDVIDQEPFKAHIFIASSGTTKLKANDLKLVALSKKAILCSASAVNQHLQAVSSDVWLSALPLFHVGGLGILARSHLTGSNLVLLETWNPEHFVELILKHSVTLTSLVPAQVFDLVLLKIEPPKTLRAVIVGGGAIDSALYEQALLLGWPLLLSYGLTECASQVATSYPNSKQLHFLSHIEAKINREGYLTLKSAALLTAHILVSDITIFISDPKSEGWLTTEDLATIDEGILTVHGRHADFIKIGGEGVVFSSLEKRLEEIRLNCQFMADAALVAFPDERLGHVIHLVANSKEISHLVAQFNASVMPYERIRAIHLVDQIPRSPLRKIYRQELLHLLKSAQV